MHYISCLLHAYVKLQCEASFNLHSLRIRAPFWISPSNSGAVYIPPVLKLQSAAADAFRSARRTSCDITDLACSKFWKWSSSISETVEVSLSVIEDWERNQEARVTKKVCESGCMETGIVWSDEAALENLEKWWTPEGIEV